MSTRTKSPQQASEPKYQKGIEAELDGNFDLAFKLYVEAAKSHLASATSASNDKERVRSKANAQKCIERAERVKAAKRDAIKPIARDQFAADEQSQIIQQSSTVHGVQYDIWKDSAITPQRSSSSTTQPDFGEALSSKSPQWRRPEEAFPRKDITIASASLDPRRILQNVITDCSLCASIVIALEHHRKFESKLCLSSLYPQNGNGYPCFSDTGQYAVRVYANGASRKRPRTVIDDYLPFYANGQPICVSTAPHFDLWPALIEKAYLKFAGGYDFPGSNSGIDLHVLTGWIPEFIDLKRNSDLDYQKTWNRISSGFRDGTCVLTVGTGLRDSPELHGVRLLKTHSYAVLDIQELDGERWITIYSPRINPSALKASTIVAGEEELDLKNLSLEDQPDTLQFRVRDARDTFESLYISWNPSLFANKLELHGVWKRKSNTRYPQCVHQRLRLDASSAQAGDELCVLLTRHFVDRRRKVQFISLHAQQEDVLHDSKTDVQAALKGIYTSSTHALARLTLDKPIGHVSLFASYDGDFEDISFTVQVFSSTRLSWIRESPKHTYTQTVEGSFTAKNSGGNSTYPSFMNNPQYHVRIRANQKEAKSSIRIVVEGPRDVPLNTLLVRSANGERITNLLPGGIVANSGAYRYGIAQAIADVKAGDYAVIISTYEPRFRGAYTLRIESTLEVDISPVPMEGAGMFCKTVRGQWSTGVDGGSPNFGKYDLNPKFELRVTSTTYVKARLQISGPSHPLAVNVSIFTSGSERSLGRQMSTTGPYADHTTGVVTPLVSLEPGKYIAVCSTYDPGTHSEFLLILYSKMSEVGVTRLQ